MPTFHFYHKGEKASELVGVDMKKLEAAMQGPEVIMKVNGRMVERYWQSAVDDMHEKRLKDVLCPCRKCKGIVRLDPFEGGTFKAHLLMHGFMHGHTRWISEDDDDEDVDGAGNKDMGPPDDEMTDYVPEEEDSLGNVDGEEAVQGGEDADTPPSSSLLSSVVRDPHVRDLLRKKTTSDRAASREEAKLAQLEVDLMTPLYDGCNPEVTRLSFTLELLNTKAKNKWTDTSLDELLKYLKKVLPAGSLCPTSVEEAKKKSCALVICHTFDITYASMTTSYIGTSTRKKTICPKCNASRYKKAGKKAPQKVVWYFPITPRLQRYFVDPKEAKLMRWHAERVKPDDGDEPEVRHLPDASQSRALNAEFDFFRK
nr:uncharacterized protein LOC120969352 isoform X2 [Aegilops tauschii subsp. strangulata]